MKWEVSRRATRVSEVFVAIREVGKRFHGQRPSHVEIMVRRTWARRRRKTVVFEFTTNGSGSTLIETVVGIIEKAGKPDPADLVPLIDQILENEAWQRQDKVMDWFLDQLRLVAGLTPVKV
jgi:hypothetical protein